MTPSCKGVQDVPLVIIPNQVYAELMTFHAIHMDHLLLLRNVLNVQLGMYSQLMDFSVLDKSLGVSMILKADAHLVKLHSYIMEKVAQFMAA